MAKKESMEAKDYIGREVVIKGDSVSHRLPIGTKVTISHIHGSPSHFHFMLIGYGCYVSVRDFDLIKNDLEFYDKKMKKIDKDIEKWENILQYMDENKIKVYSTSEHEKVEMKKFIKSSKNTIKDKIKKVYTFLNYKKQ